MSESVSEEETYDSGPEVFLVEYNQRQNEHNYLNNTDDDFEFETLTSAPFVEPEPGTRLKIPVFLSSTVVLPNQIVPINSLGIEANYIKKALEDKFPFVGILSTSTETDDNVRLLCDTGVLIGIKKFTVKPTGFTFVGIGTQRFRLITEFNQSLIETGGLFSAILILPSVQVEVLNEYTLQPFYFEPSCAFNRLPEGIRQRYCWSLTGLSIKSIEMRTTEKIVRRLIEWLKLFLREERVQNALEKGLSFFSYWAALSIPINDKRKLELLRIDNVDLRLQLECQWLSRLKKLNCKCGSPKINVLHLFNFMSESLSSCFNIKAISNPSSEYSWFEGYAWTIIVCKDCDAHVGWKFQAENKLPSTFYAVLRCLEIPNDFSEET
ncbi:Protein cereblon [Aphelenchoides besseyi]|nr:Protein cereblon [Aphelenchoides besseyi]